QLLLMGEPPPARGLPGSACVQARAIRSGGASEPAKGSLYPVWRRPQDLHRDALRGARDSRDRGHGPAPIPAGSRARLVDAGPPDADAVAPGRPADARRLSAQARKDPLLLSPSDGRGMVSRLTVSGKQPDEACNAPD